jgi:hypothetical protein
MTVLIFIGLNLLALVSISTGSDVHLHVGVTGWLQLHRSQGSWSVEHVSVLGLAVQLCLAILLTWILSTVLRRRRYDCQTAA